MTDETAEQSNEPVPIDDLLIPDDDRDQLNRLCAAARQAKERETSYNTLYKELLTEIRKITDQLPDFPERVLGTTWDLRRLAGESEKISAERLLEYGVSLRVVQEATVKTPWETYALYGVGRRKRKEAEGE